MRKKFAEDELLGRFRLKHNHGLRIDPKPTPPEEVEEAAKALEPVMASLETKESTGSNLSIDWDTNDFEAPESLPSEEALKAILFGEPVEEMSIEEHVFYKSQRHQKMLELLAKVEALTPRTVESKQDSAIPNLEEANNRDTVNRLAQNSESAASALSKLDMTHFSEVGYDEAPEGEYDEVPEEGYDEVPEEGYDEVPEEGYDEVPEEGYDEVHEAEYDEVPEEGTTMRSESEAKLKEYGAQAKARDENEQASADDPIKLNVDQEDFQERLIRILNENYGDMGEVKPQNLKSRLIEILNEEYAEGYDEDPEGGYDETPEGEYDENLEEEYDESLEEEYDEGIEAGSGKTSDQELVEVSEPDHVEVPETGDVEKPEAESITEAHPTQMELPEVDDVKAPEESVDILKDEAGFLSQDYDPYKAELTEESADFAEAPLPEPPKASKPKIDFREYQYVTSFHEVPIEEEDEAEPFEAIFHEITDETADDVKDEISDEVVDDVTDEIEDEVSEEIEDQVSDVIEDEVSIAVRDEDEDKVIDEIVVKSADKVMEETLSEGPDKSKDETDLRDEAELLRPEVEPFQKAESHKHEHPWLKELKRESVEHRWTKKAEHEEMGGKEDHGQNKVPLSQEERYAGNHVRTAAGNAEPVRPSRSETVSAAVQNSDRGMSMEEWSFVFDTLKEQIDYLKQQLEIKDHQLQNKDELIRNFQILLKNEQDKFLKLENKMEDVVLQVEERATKKGFFSRFRKR
ncbi:hypothetical protein [Acidaminobacter hydrogenoformans]|uniref:Uncharacterized protein n=1 Tax=Acidaminobacter hydrogenoformans DSM 2784 TaxID=1120920 RepID=A0A1G5RWS7_9FIRM|nr:hypothetical protein [Acidaminobacter hydrogenoformans]SCZ78318.1 hypothetical protein SAMN03080599_01206 [Acidaminobacter hydrogenoformans DSM 2784]